MATDSVYWIWFQLMFGYGTRRSELLMHHFENPQELYEGTKTNGRIQEMLRPDELAACDGAMQKAKEIQVRTLRKGCKIITPDHSEYPPLLQHIYAKPAALYVKGSLDCTGETATAIAMVGARKSTVYGERVAKRLASDLAPKGVTIVSGLALGIDTVCHTAALEAGGCTIGILGCGIDVDYPKGSASLKRAMVDQGAVLTEFPLGTPPRAGNFPIRNRVLAGISRGTVVVEAGSASGSLLTAGHALEQGRDVFAVPGDIFSPTSQGTHALLRDGARPATCAEDILEEYGFSPARTKAEQEYCTIKEQIKPLETIELASPPRFVGRLPEGLSKTSRSVLALLGEMPATVDELTVQSGFSVSELHTALTELEIYGLVQALPGRRYTVLQQ